MNSKENPFHKAMQAAARAQREAEDVTTTSAKLRAVLATQPSPADLPTLELPVMPDPDEEEEEGAAEKPKDPKKRGD